MADSSVYLETKERPSTPVKYTISTTSSMLPPSGNNSLVDDAIRWCENTRSSLQETSYGSDLSTLRAQHATHVNSTHKQIIDYGNTIERLKHSTVGIYIQ